MSTISSVPPPAQPVQFPGSFARTSNTIESNTVAPDQNQSVLLRTAACASFRGSFAAELRGNQNHVLTGQAQSQGQRRAYELGAVVKRQRWKETIYAYVTEEWDHKNLYKSAFIEFVGTTALCYLSAMIGTTIMNSGTTQPAAYVCISNIILLSLFIYALAPASGGHVNPTITLTTMLAGLTGFARGLLYIIAQTIGGALAGGLIRGSFGRTLTLEYAGGGCFLDTKVLTVAQVYLIESVLSFILLSLSVGVGLDPRQAAVFGPKLGPFLTACSLGLVSAASVGLAEGYPGAGMNPARCFAFGVARGEFKHQWIWWAGPLTGAIFQSVVYHIAPPYHKELAEDRVRGANKHVETNEKKTGGYHTQGSIA